MQKLLPLCLLACLLTGCAAGRVQIQQPSARPVIEDGKLQAVRFQSVIRTSGMLNEQILYQVRLINARGRAVRSGDGRYQNRAGEVAAVRTLMVLQSQWVFDDATVSIPISEMELQVRDMPANAEFAILSPDGQRLASDTIRLPLVLRAPEEGMLPQLAWSDRPEPRAEPLARPDERGRRVASADRRSSADERRPRGDSRSRETADAPRVADSRGARERSRIEPPPREEQLSPEEERRARLEEERAARADRERQIAASRERSRSTARNRSAPAAREEERRAARSDEPASRAPTPREPARTAARDRSEHESAEPRPVDRNVGRSAAEERPAARRPVSRGPAPAVAARGKPLVAESSSEEAEFPRRRPTPPRGQSEEAPSGERESAPPVPTVEYRVRAGDTLTTIASRQLLDASRWIEIFDLNRDQIDAPEELREGMVLKVPSRPTTRPARQRP